MRHNRATKWLKLLEQLLAGCRREPVAGSGNVDQVVALNPIMVELESPGLMSLAVGTRLGPYQIVSLLGVGGMDI